MKATIEIPDSLAVDALEVAREDGTTLHELVLVGLRAEIESRRGAAQMPEFRFPTVGGEGIVSELASADVLVQSYS